MKKNRYAITENIEDHTNYFGQSVRLLKEVRDSYFIATDGRNKFFVGIEELTRTIKNKTLRIISK